MRTDGVRRFLMIFNVMKTYRFKRSNKYVKTKSVNREQNKIRTEKQQPDRCIVPEKEAGS